MTSLSQREKIEELEAQLNEAEDVIADLRIELKQLQGALEKVKRNQVRSLNGRVKKEDASSHGNAAADPIRPSLSNSEFETVTTSEMKNAPLNQSVSVDKSCSTAKGTEQPSVSLPDNGNAHNSDFACILMRSKEPELYRNGFTQRIRAFEKNLLNGKVPPGVVDDQHSIKKKEFTEMIDKDKGKFHLPSTSGRNTEMVNSSIEGEVKKPVKLCISRRRNTRSGKAKATSWKSCLSPGQLMKLCQPSNVLSCCKTYAADDNVKLAEDAFNLLSTKADAKQVHEMKGQKEMKSRDVPASFKSLSNQLSKPCQALPVFSRCSNSSNSISKDVKSGEDRLQRNEADFKIRPLTLMDPALTSVTHDVDPISASANFTVNFKAINESGLVKNVRKKDSKLLYESVTLKEGADAVNMMNPSSELNFGMVNVPLMNLFSKDAEVSAETNGSPSQADNNRLLRYTFQRKRKKELLSSPDEKASLENTSNKRRTGEKQCDAPTPKDSSLVNESSRDSRRLAQVAHQVGFLSLPSFCLVCV